MVGTITLSQLGAAFRRMPGAMWIAQADGIDRAFRGFWKSLKSRMQLRRSGAGYTLTSPKAWPFEITTQPVPSYESPNWALFRARMGADSAAAVLHETGGRVAPTKARLLAIPVGHALTSAGRVRPGYSTPAKAMARGKKFVAIRDRRGRIRLHEITRASRRRGRPGKGATNTAAQALSAQPAFVLVSSMRAKARLNFRATWRADYPNAQRRIGENIARAVRDVLAGAVPKVVFARARSEPA